MAKNLTKMPCLDCGKYVRADKKAVSATCSECATKLVVDTRRTNLGRKALQVAKAFCATYNKTSDECQELSAPCSLESGGRCRWFEQAVLGTAKVAIANRPKSQGRDMSEAIALYEDWHMRGGKDRRTCKCGAPLYPRRRLCDDCQEKARHATYRKARKTAKSKKIATLTELPV